MKEQVRRILVRSLMSGSATTCPLCGFAARRAGDVGIALPLFKQQRIVGAGQRRGRCLMCHARDREQLVALYLRGQFANEADQSEKSVLHIAPEPRLAKFIEKQRFKEYLRGDRREPGYRYPETTIPMDITDLPYPSLRFDLVICNHVLEHVPEDRKAMSELFRVLKPGGVALLQVPLALDLADTQEDPAICTDEQRLQAYGQADHVRLYGKDYAQRLAQCGFRVTELDLASTHREVALNPLEKLHVCHRDSG